MVRGMPLEEGMPTLRSPCQVVETIAILFQGSLRVQLMLATWK
jgi:hypothetical protein